MVERARNILGRALKHVKKIGFLSFGRWTESPARRYGRRPDSCFSLEFHELAVAAESLGADGAYFRVHHFARQLGSPFPLLAAVVGTHGRTIEIGNGRDRQYATKTR